jgi:hypothetical protein
MATVAAMVMVMVMVIAMATATATVRRPMVASIEDMKDRSPTAAEDI